MNGIGSFVDAFCYRFGSISGALEEDQRLPPREILEDICHVLLNVSTMREEGRFPSFRVCFIRPDSELLSTYIYSHASLFDAPLEFSEKELYRLAPALNADISYLLLDISGKEYKITGILSAFTIWEKIIIREVSIGNRLPRIPNIYVKGAGELEACFGESPIVDYKSGASVIFRTNTFITTLAAKQLRNGSNRTQEERLRLIYRILWRIRQYRHGALLYIVPSADACEKYLDIKYKLPIRYLFGSEERSSQAAEVRKAKDGITYAELIAKFSAVDGAVVLTKDLDLVGFGAETLVDSVSRKHPRMRFVEYDDSVNSKKTFHDNGMRHRACYYLCDNVEDAVSVIISQDGIVKVCTKSDGEVIVYDNVALPLL